MLNTDSSFLLGTTLHKQTLLKKVFLKEKLPRGMMKWREGKGGGVGMTVS